MADRTPVVVNSGEIQQIQSGDVLVVPVAVKLQASVKIEEVEVLPRLNLAILT